MAKQVFHTGKVAIGLAYEPDPRPTLDRDALRLQRALISRGQPLRERLNWDRLAVAGSTAVIACTAVLLLQTL